MNVAMTGQLTLKQASKKIVPLALTMAGTQFINVASSFLCMIMLAHLGRQVLAASALMISTQITVMVIGMSILFSLSLLIGHAYGAKNFAAIGQFLQQGWTLAVLISIPIILIFWFIGPILKTFGQSPALIPIITQYFHAYVWAVLPFQLSVATQQLCYGTHQQRLAIITSSCSVSALLVVAYLLIFGQLGFPPLGVAGLGYAVSVQAWFGLILMTVLLYQRENFKEFNLWPYRAHKNLAILRQIFKIGWPMSLQMMIEMIFFFVLAMMVGWIGANALAASQIVNQYLFLTVVPVFALSQACGIAVGQAKGAGQLHEIKNLGYASLRIALIWALTAGLAFVLFPKLLASFYLNMADPANAITIRLVIWLFFIAAFAQTFDAVRNIMTGALRGLFDTQFPMYMGIVALWLIALPLAYLFAFGFQWGVFGVSLGAAAGMFAGALIILYRWRKLTGGDF